MQIISAQEATSDDFAIDHVEAELERMSQLPAHEGIRFPTACLNRLSRQSPENEVCMDCRAPDPEWASVHFGCLLCNDCSGEHRAMGRRSIVIRHLTMDSWSYEQVLTMLEGGNHKLQRYFEIYRLTSDQGPRRYNTKVAKYYRSKLATKVRTKIAGSTGFVRQQALPKVSRRSTWTVGNRTQSSELNSLHEDECYDNGGQSSSDSNFKISSFE